MIALEAGLELHHLIKTKTPKVLITSIGSLSDKQSAELKGLLHTYVKAVQEEDFTPSPSFMCGSCEYFNDCKNVEPASLTLANHRQGGQR